MSDAVKDVKERALALLARREHGEKELQQKLLSRGLDAEDIALAIEQLKQEGLQSDSRYTEAFVHDRVSRGYGPRHILHELKQKGVGAEFVEEFLDERGPEWIERLAEVRKRKFGEQLPDDYKEQARQSRFLQYRGFSTDQIHRLFKRLNEYDD